MDSARVYLDGFGSVSYWIISSLLSGLWLAALGVNGAWDRKILGAGPSEYATDHAGVVLPVRIRRDRVVPDAGRDRPLVPGYRPSAGSLRSLRRSLGLATAAWRSTAAAGPTSVRWWSSAVPPARWHWRRGSGAPRAPASRWPDCACRAVRPHGAIEGEAVEHGFPVVGDLTDVAEAIARTGAHMVAVAASESFGPQEIRALAWKLEGSGVALALVPASHRRRRPTHSHSSGSRPAADVRRGAGVPGPTTDPQDLVGLPRCGPARPGVLAAAPGCGDRDQGQ